MLLKPEMSYKPTPIGHQNRVPLDAVALNRPPLAAASTSSVLNLSCALRSRPRKAAWRRFTFEWYSEVSFPGNFRTTPGFLGFLFYRGRHHFFVLPERPPRPAKLAWVILRVPTKRFSANRRDCGAIEPRTLSP